MAGRERDVRAGELVAVTFTDKAAGELRARLAALGVEGVRASTFHSAALALLRRFAGRPGADPLDEGAAAAADRQRAAAAVPVPAGGRPRDGGRVGEEPPADAADVPRGLGDHEPPLPADLAHRVFREYEKRKAAAGAIDFEDLLERAIAAARGRATPRARSFRERYRAFTVDEYQDVNLLQQSLLDLWLGERDELCVVGDDYQSIYGFTGASAAVAARVAGAVPARARRSARAELPLDAAGARAREPARAAARRRGEDAARDAADGPEPDPAARDAEAEAPPSSSASAAAGVPLEEQAVLVRTNARAADFEEALHEAGIPFQGASLLGREAARRLLKALPADRVARGRGRAQARARAGLARGSAREARRARADAPGRPRASRPAGGAVRRRGAEFVAGCASASARAQAAASTS